MSRILDRGRTLYQALAEGDGEALAGLLSDSFQGRLAEGLPDGFGRLYDGREAMMTEGWGAIGRVFAMSPRIEAMFADGDTLIGRGCYVGEAKPTGRPVRAAFAHFWGFDGERFASVRQVTDTGLWRDALAPMAEVTTADARGSS